MEQLASSTRPERGRKENQESSPAAGAETAASVGSGRRPAASSPKRAIPAAVVDRIEGRSGAKGVSPESVETTHQSPSEGADCEVAPGRTRSPSLPGYRKYMVQNKRRAWIAPKRRPRPEASESRVKKEFIEIKPSRGVTMVSLTASEASDVGDMEEVPETAPAPSEAPRSRQSSGLTGAERVTSETIIRIGTTPQRSKISNLGLLSL